MKCFMNHRAEHRGFALLMTLVLVLLAGISLASVARKSASMAVEARQAADEMKRRWVVESMQATLLGNASALFEKFEMTDRDGDGEPDGRPRPIRRIDLKVELDGVSYRLRLTDESAKFNVNTLLNESGTADAQMRLRKGMLQAIKPLNEVISLAPLPAGPTSSGSGTVVMRIGSYSQIFDEADPQRLLGTAQKPGPESFVTCWSSGLVNVNRASDEVIELALSRKVEPPLVAELLRIRQEMPGLSLGNLLTKITKSGDEQQEKLRKYLTDQSDSFGLWIVADDVDRQRAYLAVMSPMVLGERSSSQSVASQSIYRFDW